MTGWFITWIGLLVGKDGSFGMFLTVGIITEIMMIVSIDPHNDFGCHNYCYWYCFCHDYRTAAWSPTITNPPHWFNTEQDY